MWPFKKREPEPYKLRKYMLLPLPYDFDKFNTVVYEIFIYDDIDKDWRKFLINELPYRFLMEFKHADTGGSSVRDVSESLAREIIDSLEARRQKDHDKKPKLSTPTLKYSSMIYINK